MDKKKKELFNGDRYFVTFFFKDYEWYRVIRGDENLLAPL